MTKLIPISRFTVNGNSMIPTLHPGQDVLSINWFVKPRVGDMVIVNRLQGTVDREIIKRIVRIEGENVYIEGDNREESTDSRHFGPIRMDQIVGKVIYMDSRSRIGVRDKLRGNDMVDCPNCGSEVLGIYGRKDAICGNCGFKLTCCGEP